MTAYELAKELELMLLQIGIQDNRIPKMLRQQADRIERKRELIREQTALLVKQNNRIAELEDRLSMYEIKDLDRGIIGRTKDYVIHDLVHRTTPQIKEFTQAELKEIVENNTKYDYVDYFNLALDMNKAILKKASEK
jgi:uncharacterized protein (UPF0147 family)